MSTNGRLERLEKYIEGFGYEDASFASDEVADVVIYDPKAGPPEPLLGDSRPRILIPDNGRGPGGSKP